MTMRTVLAAIIAVTLLCSTTAHAQSVSRPTFLALQKVQELSEAEQYEEAKVALEELLTKVKPNSYDFAITNQYLAHTSVMLDDSRTARTALEAALATTELPEELRLDMNLFYGTVLIGDEEFELARRALEEWFAAAPRPKPSQIFSLAYANYMSDDLERAEHLVARAIGEAPQPPESWYQLYYRVLLELKKFEVAEAVLLGMLERNPTSRLYWRMLASHHLQLERSSEALAAIMVAYTGSLIDDTKDLEQIVSLYSYIDVPEKGARMLEEWMGEEKLPEDAETLKQLGNMGILKST